MWVASLGLIVVKTLIFFPSLGNELAIVTWGRMLCHCSDQVAFSPAFRLFYEEAYCLDITTSSQRQAAISRAHHIPRSAGVAQVR